MAHYKINNNHTAQYLIVFIFSLIIIILIVIQFDGIVLDLFRYAYYYLE